MGSLRSDESMDGSLLHRRFANLVSPERSRMQIEERNLGVFLRPPQDVVVGPRVFGMERIVTIGPATDAVTPRTHSGRAERRVLTRSNGSLATNDRIYSMLLYR